MADNILEMKEITKRFPGVLALNKVTFSVRRGEVHALCGENGAGKSTLMKVLSGVYNKDEGMLFLENQERIFTNVRESEEAGITIVHQELNVVKNLTVCENVFLGNELAKKGIIDWKTQNIETQQAIDRVGLNVSPNTLVLELSPGQQQMLEIARAINKRVKVLIFDEPTSSLTEQETKQLLKLIKQLQKDGISIIYISHKLEEIFEICDTVTILRDGQTIVTKPIEKINECDLIAQMVGRELNDLYPTCSHTPQETIFEVKNWSVPNVNLPGKMLINNVSFHAKKGEILGIAGLMGAGRTELALSIFGAAYKKNSGILRVNGKEIENRNPRDAIRNGIGYVTEDRKKLGLVMGLSIRENIALPNFNKLSSYGVINNSKEITETANYSKNLRVKTPSIMQQVKNLSGGNQQKVILAKWLMTDPDILIVDEPTRGIDVGAKFEIYTIMEKLAAEGKCIIVISSEMPEIIGICDRVYVMAEGVIVGELEKAEIEQTKIMKCIQGGI